jgi:hypothetical protein
MGSGLGDLAGLRIEHAEHVRAKVAAQTMPCESTAASCRQRFLSRQIVFGDDHARCLAGRAGYVFSGYDHVGPALRLIVLRRRRGAEAILHHGILAFAATHALLQDRVAHAAAVFVRPQLRTLGVLPCA